jgi:diguanylate cyclase
MRPGLNQPGFTRSPLPRRAESSVADCMAALARSQAALALALDRNRCLEQDVSSARAALVEARAELTRIQAEAALARHQALHDGLTRLPNRRLFRDRLGQALSAVRPGPVPLAVFYLDLDGFKPINDLHGHEAGDELLRIVASRLLNAVRGDDVVCRLGGDEFGCLFAKLSDRQQLLHVATKLFKVVSAPLTIGRLELSVRPSIGIARCPVDGATAEELLRNADAAMYRAKRHQTGYAFVERRLGRTEPPPVCSIAHRPGELAPVD